MMNVWPYIPDVRHIEALEWRTDVLRTYGSEQRIALRKVPRQSFYPEYTIGQRQFARAKQFIASNYGRAIYVPAWPDATEVGNVTSTQTVFSLTTTALDVFDGDPILLWQDDETFEVETVASVTASSITITAQVGANLTRAMLVPLRTGRFESAPGFSRGPHEWTQVSASFLCLMPRDIAQPSVYPEYQGEPVITDRSFVMGDFEESVYRPIKDVDFGLGLFTQEDLEEDARLGSQMIWFCRSRADIWNARRFLYWARGRAKRFYLPTWNDDLQLAATLAAGSTTLTTQSSTLTAPFDIQFNLNGGGQIRRRVSSGGPTSWTLADAPGVEVTTSNLESISLLKLMRLDADRVEIQHKSARQADIAVPLIEIPEIPPYVPIPVTYNVIIGLDRVVINGDPVVITE